MDTVSFRDLAVAETDTKTLLAHATQQGIQRRYEDFLIVDVDGHHYENMSYAEIIEYIEDPVIDINAFSTRRWLWIPGSSLRAPE